jgi:hypothetical protein
LKIKYRNGSTAHIWQGRFPNGFTKKPQNPYFDVRPWSGEDTDAEMAKRFDGLGTQSVRGLHHRKWRVEIMPLTPAMITLATGCPKDAVETHWPILVQALEVHGIRTDPMEIVAAATIAIETAHTFLPIHEFGGRNPEAYFTKHYEGRIDLGNTQPGDGARFHGRGWPQLTGRANYRTYGSKVGVDLEFEPDRALEPILSANLFALFALDKHIAQLADAKDWLTIRKRWNGVNRRTGLPNGWEEFKLYVHRLLALVSP